MNTYLILAKIIDQDLFAQYIKGHIPTIAKFGGKVVFRSVNNVAVFGDKTWDAIAMQDWPDSASFERWWNSEEYRPWSQLRDKAAEISIIKCDNLAGKL